MYCIAIVGYSFVPNNIAIPDIPDITIDIVRRPGAMINSLPQWLNRQDFRNKTYDLIIVCIGGNDLATRQVSQASV